MSAVFDIYQSHTLSIRLINKDPKPQFYLSLLLLTLMGHA